MPTEIDAERKRRKHQSSALVLHPVSHGPKGGDEADQVCEDEVSSGEGKTSEELQLADNHMKQAAASLGMNRPKHLGDGIVSGLKAAGGGALVGLGYLFYAPYAGAKENGFKGFGSGLVKGVAGAVAAPVVGAVMGATQIVRGVVNTPIAVSAGMVSTHFEHY